MAHIGRIPTLNKDEQNIRQELIKENSRSSKVVAQKRFDKTGKRLSHFRCKRLAKDFGLSAKRVRKSLKSKRDEKKFRKAKSELEAFSLLALTNAKNPPKGEGREKPITKASESDIEVFKQLIDRDKIIIFDTQNIKKVAKPKNNVVATKTDSSSVSVLSEVDRNVELPDEGVKPKTNAVATFTASSSVCCFERS